MEAADEALPSEIRLTDKKAAPRIREARTLRVSRSLPPRSTAGQLTLDQHIGVRIPGGQPNSFQQFSYWTHSPLWGLLWGLEPASNSACSRFRSSTALRICSIPGC